MTEPRFMSFRNSAGESWTERVPEQVSREIDACFSIDVLAAALTAARAELEQVGGSLNKLAADASAAEVLAASNVQTARLVLIIDRLNTSGQAVIDAVKVMLAL